MYAGFTVIPLIALTSLLSPTGRPAATSPVAAAAKAAAASPAATAATAATAAQTVTVYLGATDAGALDALAKDRSTPRAARLARLAQLVPQAATRATVADRLRGLGMTVTAQSTWSVTATAPAATVRSLFGSARGARPQDHVGQGLPTLPGPLRGLVQVAVGGDETRPALHRLATPPDAGLSPEQARSAYHSTVPGGPVPTVATMQLAGWNPTDLSTYAAAAGVANPLANGRYQPVNVGRTQDYVSADGDGDVEVALDQEAILAAAPTAKQLAYFAPNTFTGILNTFARVGTDARAPGMSVVAFSSSWGACEDQWDPAVRTTAQQLLAAAAAAGVTLFAASGDDGTDDCGSGAASVDFPASSPNVVAVGGTTLTGSIAGGWTETGWTGSGGGCSTVFAKPTYQAGTPCTGRAVPDIAADANLDTGFAIEHARVGKSYAGYAGKWLTVGGTSLSSPLTAGFLADEWARSGGNGRYGDIHAALYGAPASSFRDVTVGNNGGYAAGAGYDLVTGRGTPNWAALGPQLTLTNPLPAGAVFAAVGTNRALYAAGLSPSGFRKLASVGATAPNVVRVGTHALYVIGGTDHNIYASNGDNPWAKIGPTGTVCLGQGATAVGSTLWVGCRGSDGGLWVGSAPLGNGPAVVGQITRWTNLGGKLLGAPAVATPGGVVTWYITGTGPTGANFFHRTATTGYVVGQVRCAGPPGAGTFGTTTYSGCVTGTKAVAFRATANGAFLAGGGAGVGAPGFAVAADGTARAALIGTNGALYTRSLRPSGAAAAGWVSLGGVFALGVGGATIG